MSQMKFIVREPLLDPKERVLGYELTWQGDGADGTMAGMARLPGSVTLGAMVRTIAGPRAKLGAVASWPERTDLRVPPAVLVHGILDKFIDKGQLSPLNPIK